MPSILTKQVDYNAETMYNLYIFGLVLVDGVQEGMLMLQQKKRIDATSADKQQIGFEYQYLYFILRLLHMEPGEIVGYEALDDVHVIDATKKPTTYIQVKHTIDTAIDGTQANLTKFSDDLWKTLSNWSKLISDPAEGRIEKTAQIAFVKKANFILVVNRRIDNNEVVKKLQQAKDEKLTATTIKTYLRDLKLKTSDQIIKEYIDNVYKLSASVISVFFSNITIISSTSNIFEEIRESIRGKMIPDEYVNDVFSSLYLQLKEDFFKDVQTKKHQVITYDDWLKKYRSIFNTYRTTLLPFREYHPPLPERLEEQVFVKELVEIGAIDIENYGLSEIAELTQFYLKIELQLNDWYDDGKITLEQRDNFHRDAVITWKRIHQSCHRATRNDMSQNNANALNCYYDVMKEKLSILSTEIGLPLSNGEFIKLANEKQIGWKYNWKGRNA